MFKFTSLRAVAALILCSVVSTTVWGQHGGHAGDAEFYYDQGKIVFEDHTGKDGFLDGKKLFGADMGVGGLFDGFSANPGFISETDIGLGINPNDIIDYEVVQSRFGFYLNYWNPLTGQVESTTSTLEIFDKPSGSFVISSGVGGTGPGVIGQADDLGDFHSHVDFQLSSGSQLGVYAMLMELSTSSMGIANSDRFWVVFNYGVDEATHDAAMDFLAGVPEPTSGLAAALVAGCGLLVRRRRG